MTYEEERKQGVQEISTELTRVQTLRIILMRLVNLPFQLCHRPLLARFLSESLQLEAFYKLRLKEDLHKLIQMSLMSTNSNLGGC